MVRPIKTGHCKKEVGYPHLNEFRLYHRKDGCVVKEGDDRWCRTRARDHHRLRLAATLDDGCVIGRTSRMYSASAAQKFWA